MRIFFTYVWGPPGEPAWPLTFASKGSRTRAKRLLEEGDLVFTVCTSTDPTPREHWGRVVGLYRVSDMEVNTGDYDLPRKNRHPEIDSVTRFPYALHPIEVSEITAEKSVFSELVGPLTPTHHLQAQSYIVELDSAVARPLLELARREVEPALPKTEFGLGRVVRKNSKLAPKHEGGFVGRFGDHAIWYVYTLVLRDTRGKPLAVKVGYAHDPEIRRIAHNSPLATEITGLRWDLDLQQPTSSEEAARLVEQAVLSRFNSSKLASNGEILANVDPTSVAVAIAEELRARTVGDRRQGA